MSRYSGSPCKISHCVESISGLASNSSSPTDTWIIKFRPGTKYENKLVDKGFMKIFLSTRHLANAKYDYLLLLEGLAYEVKIYRDIIRPLVDHQICPNFVKYLGSAINCSYGDMSVFLGKTVPEANLLRNIFYIGNELSNRPSINNPAVDPAKSVSLVQAQSQLYDFLITEPTGPSDYQTLAAYVASPGLDINELFKMYFQIVVACYALSLSKTSHNDLHLGNIFLEYYGAPQQGKLINYVVNDVYFPLNIKYICRLYDFDRTYSSVVGKNLLLTATSARSSSQENKFYPSKDIMKVSGYIVSALQNNNDALEMVRDTVTNGGAHWNQLYEMWAVRRNFFLQGPGPGGAPVSLATDFYAKFPDPERMLENLVGKMRGLGLFEAPGQVLAGDTYILSRKMFEDGYLNLRTVAFDRTQLQKEKGDLQEQVQDYQTRLAESQTLVSETEARLAESQVLVSETEARRLECAAEGQAEQNRRRECMVQGDLLKGRAEMAESQYKDLFERKEQYKEALGNCQRQLRRDRLEEERRDEPMLEDWEMVL